MDNLKKSAGHNTAASDAPTTGKAFSQHPVLTVVAVICLFLLLLLLNGCSTAVRRPAPSNPPVVQEPSDHIKEYEIHPGDKLEIKFFYNPDLNESVIVRPDGRISLQLANEVMAAGLTPSELTDILTEKYSTEIIDPTPTVIVRSFNAQRAYVDGQIGRPGMINLIGDITVSQAIAKAGGLRNTARRHEVLVIRRKADRKPFVIPVNLKQVTDGTDIDQDIVLQPYDIVFVPKSAIANVNLWMRQYIYNNFPQRLIYFQDFYRDE